jgi:hypothetical protein
VLLCLFEGLEMGWKMLLKSHQLLCLACRDVNVRKASYGGRADQTGGFAGGVLQPSSWWRSPTWCCGGGTGSTR